MGRSHPIAGLESGRMADAGWTLVEMLVALVLLSLLTMLLMGSVYSSRQAIGQIQVRDGEMSVETVQNYLRHAISEARPIRQANSAPDTPLIEGTGNRLRLITSYAPAGQFNGLYAIGLEAAFNERKRTYDLVETRTLHRPPSEPGAPEPARPFIRSRLLKDVRNVSFRYYGVQDEPEVRDWADKWTDLTRLPELVEMRVLFATGDNRSWLPLVIALPVGR